jgi:hypothetical protein
MTTTLSMLRSNANSMTIYKQKPGSDIEAGWWIAIHAEWRNYPTLSDKHIGPFRTKRDAIAAAKLHTVAR